MEFLKQDSKAPKDCVGHINIYIYIYSSIYEYFDLFKVVYVYIHMYIYICIYIYTYAYLSRNFWGLKPIHGDQGWDRYWMVTREGLAHPLVYRHPVREVGGLAAWKI